MNKETIIQELTFKAVRSSGAGGQNVNKVSSK
ncbi:MAG: aminoacyl-tRNA hydrolase, partial [Pedobacter sp.]